MREFPASGWRNNSSGGLDGSPSNGRYWSSSPYASGNNNGGNLNFNNGGTVNARNNNNRANGFSVRCVSELELRNEKRVVCYDRECGKAIKRCFATE
ncbi:hypothetical protein [Bacteroides sp.]